MTDGTTVLGEVVESGARRGREAENCDASVRRSCRADCVAVRGSQRVGRSAHGTATALDRRAVHRAASEEREEQKGREERGERDYNSTLSQPSETNLFRTENCRRKGYTSLRLYLKDGIALGQWIDMYATRQGWKMGANKTMDCDAE